MNFFFALIVNTVCSNTDPCATPFFYLEGRFYKG